MPSQEFIFQNPILKVVLVIFGGDAWGNEGSTVTSLVTLKEREESHSLSHIMMNVLAFPTFSSQEADIYGVCDAGN